MSTQQEQLVALVDAAIANFHAGRTEASSVAEAVVAALGPAINERVAELTEALRDWLAATEAAHRDEPGSYRAVAEARGRARAVLGGS